MRHILAYFLIIKILVVVFQWLIITYMIVGVYGLESLMYIPQMIKNLVSFFILNETLYSPERDILPYTFIPFLLCMIAFPRRLFPMMACLVCTLSSASFYFKFHGWWIWGIAGGIAFLMLEYGVRWWERNGLFKPIQLNKTDSNNLVHEVKNSPEIRKSILLGTVIGLLMLGQMVSQLPFWFSYGPLSRLF